LFPTRLKSLADINEGDNFLFYGDVTLNSGMVLLGASDTLSGGSPTSPGINSWPTTVLNINYTVACSFNINGFVGNYHLDDGEGDTCTVQISIDPNVTNGLIIKNFYIGTLPPPVTNIHDVKISLDPQTFAVSSSSQVIADNLWGYGKATLGACTGLVNTCSYKITFTGDLSTAGSNGGDFGNITYVLTKD
jgi:hypothetical protein